MISTPTVASDSAGPRATRNELAWVQQNDRQREVTDHVGERIVIERDTADAVDTGQHADGEKDNQDGNTKA